MNPNPNQSTNFNGVGNKPVIFPATRFIADKDDKGVVKVGKDGEMASGVLEVKLYEATKDGSSSEVASISMPMSFKKYQAIREEIDVLSTEKLKEYFPGLKPGDKEQLKADKEELKVQTSTDLAAEMRETKIKSLEGDIQELKEALARALDLAVPTATAQPVVETPSNEEPSPSNTVERNVVPETEAKSEEAPVKASEAKAAKK